LLFGSISGTSSRGRGVNRHPRPPCGRPSVAVDAWVAPVPPARTMRAPGGIPWARFVGGDDVSGVPAEHRSFPRRRAGHPGPRIVASYDAERYKIDNNLLVRDRRPRGMAYPPINQNHIAILESAGTPISRGHRESRNRTPLGAFIGPRGERPAATPFCFPFADEGEGSAADRRRARPRPWSSTLRQGTGPNEGTFELFLPRRWSTLKSGRISRPARRPVLLRLEPSVAGGGNGFSPGSRSSRSAEGTMGLDRRSSDAGICGKGLMEWHFEMGPEAVSSSRSILIFAAGKFHQRWNVLSGRALCAGSLWLAADAALEIEISPRSSDVGAIRNDPWTCCRQLRRATRRVAAITRWMFGQNRIVQGA